MQQNGPKNIGFFGTRNMGFSHQKLIEVLSYAMVLTVRPSVVVQWCSNPFQHTTLCRVVVGCVLTALSAQTRKQPCYHNHVHCDVVPQDCRVAALYYLAVQIQSRSESSLCW